MEVPLAITVKAGLIIAPGGDETLDARARRAARKVRRRRGKNSKALIAGKTE
jgi:hypothetical protein